MLKQGLFALVVLGLFSVSASAETLQDQILNIYNSTSGTSAYGTSNLYGTSSAYGTTGAYGTNGTYGTNSIYGTGGAYGTSNVYGQYGQQMPPQQVTAAKYSACIAQYCTSQSSDCLALCARDAERPQHHRRRQGGMNAMGGPNCPPGAQNALATGQNFSAYGYANTPYNGAYSTYGYPTTTAYTGATSYSPYTATGQIANPYATTNLTSTATSGTGTLSNPYVQ
jgi:hypothetical protein